MSEILQIVLKNSTRKDLEWCKRNENDNISDTIEYLIETYGDMIADEHEG